MREVEAGPGAELDDRAACVREDGGPPLTELSASVAGGLSPFGQDHDFPMPVELVRYAHPTDKPNRAGVQLPENRR